MYSVTARRTLSRLQRSAEQGAGAFSPRVLVVDDEPIIRELLEQHLLDEGFVARSAGTIAAAYAIIRQQRPDAIVLDLMLPARSGWDFLRDRATDPDLSTIPVLVISAAAHARLDDAGHLGADALLSKPFDLDELTAVLHNFVR